MNARSGWSERDLHALTGAYAVDALDDDERELFEQHLSECADCRAETAELAATATVLADLSATVPPASLRDRVLADAAAVRPLPPLVTSLAEARRRRAPRLVAAAAAVVLLAAAGAVGYETVRDRTGCPADLGAGECRVFSASDAQTVTTRLDNGATATVVRSHTLGRAYIVTSDMPDPGKDKVFELWLRKDGQLTGAGLMPSGPDNIVLLSGDAAGADAVGITVEQAGGATTPNLSSAVLIDLDEA
ncbi:anti-sigma factor [Nocardioides acrostichi]|uniref:Regulator of SigK n=1 Tax=Nocardioides acrostichi TaxID=2784339 RepID=A0A930Y6P1_9ACTN|nr:anti-sigma factor [Nocardioides acrostichi]MBF4161151.1 anti-sigma factor [Nocardioides acrostichi]